MPPAPMAEPDRAAAASLTLFTTCRAFEGEFGVMQTNALRTWARLGLPILVLGDDPGAQDAARAIGAGFVANVARNAQGTPRIDGLFAAARAHADTSYLGYLNADILLTPAFADAVDRALRQLDPGAPALVTMRRRNLPAHRPLDVADDAHVAALRALDSDQGSWDAATAVDVFVFSRDLFDDIPDFAVGRMQWDNWLLWKARERGALVIDASPDVAALHPIHGSPNAAAGWREARQGGEAAHNRRAAQGRALSLDEAATHLLENGELLEIDEETRAALPARFAPDPERQLAAGLDYLLAGLDARPTAATLDGCRVVLERLERFVPFDAPAAPAPDVLRATLERARRDARRGAGGAAADGLQALLAEAYARTVQAAAAEGRPIAIWGCGGAGRRLKDYLTGLGVGVAGFADSDRALLGATRHGSPVVASDWPALTSQAPGALVLVASLHAHEIAAALERDGARAGRDFLM